MTTLPDVPPNDNRSGVADAIDDVAAAVRRAIEAEVGPAASFAEREQAALRIVNEATRRELVSTLQDIVVAHGEGDLLVDGQLFRPHQSGTVTYHSLVGPLPVERHCYRQVGVHNGPTVVPLELAAGLMQRATPALAYAVVLGHAKHHSRALHEDLLAAHRAPPSRTTLEKIGKRLGTSVDEHAARIESYLRQVERVADGAVGISVGLDRTAVPLQEARPAHQAPKTRRKKRTKPYERTPPPPVDVNYHMAYIGTVSLTDADGNVLVGRRYAASHEAGPDDIIRRMMADVRNALRRDAALAVGVTQDGAPEMWNLLRPALEQAGVEEWFEAIDRYHLNERLGKVLRILESDPAARKKRLHEWNEQLDEDDDTIDRIHDLIRAEKPHYVGDSFCVLDDNDTFIDNNKDRMRYVALRCTGLPVGSGATEGSCRWVVAERAKRASRRWKTDGLDAALAVRTVYCSDRLPAFFKHLQRRYVANVQDAFSEAA